MEQRANHKCPTHYIACGGEEKIHGKTGGTDISAGKHAARDEKHIGYTVLITKNYKAPTGSQHANAFPPIVFTPRASQTARHTHQLAPIPLKKTTQGFNVVLVSAIPIKAELYGSACVSPCHVCQEECK